MRTIFAALLSVGVLLLVGCESDGTVSPSASATETGSPLSTATGSPATTATATLTATETATATATPSPTATQTPAASPSATASPAIDPAGVCGENPAPPHAADPNITVEEPADGVSSDSPLAFSGEARVFEAQFNARLLTADGAVLGEVWVHASEGAPARVPYDALIAFDVPQPTAACLQVFAISARDGSMVDVVQREVVLLPGARMAGGACPLNGSPPNPDDPDIEVDFPEDGFEAAGDAIHVDGLARVFEAVVSVRLLRPDGSEILSATAMADLGAPAKAPFRADLAYAVPRGTAACLQVYSVSPRDGSIENVVQREVVLRP